MNLYMDDKRACPPGWKLARTVDDAMLLLATGEVDRCSLDHDMGACDDCVRLGLDVGDMQTTETTFAHWCPHVLDGTKLVVWLIETGNWSLQMPTVHSMNPAGRDRMRNLITRYWPERTVVWPQYPERKVIAHGNISA